MSTEPINLMGMDAARLAEMVAQWGDKPFRARQLMRWIHQQGVAQFDDMTDLAKTFRARLEQQCVVQAPSVVSRHISSDATRKWLFDVGHGNAVETVFIPEDDRGTLCISSQAGCTVACPFCSTGHQGFNRNLTSAEIIGQLWWARHELEKTGAKTRLHAGINQGDDPGSESELSGSNPGISTSGDTRIITNVVFMGMGEPLLNYDAVLGALRLMLDDHAWGLSRRRVTVSTSGVVPMMDRLAQDCPVALAVSLHAPNDSLRDRLVPLNKKYPLAELLDACRNYLEYAPRDFITFEYVMLDGINDQPEHVQQLIEISRQVSCKLNLIPFNPFPQSGLHRSPPARVREFADRLQAAGVVTTIRKTRGDDIDAACGQLAGDVKDRTRLTEKRLAEAGLKPIRMMEKSS